MGLDSNWLLGVASSVVGQYDDAKLAGLSVDEDELNEPFEDECELVSGWLAEIRQEVPGVGFLDERLDQSRGRLRSDQRERVLVSIRGPRPGAR